MNLANKQYRTFSNIKDFELAQEEQRKKELKDFCC